MKKILLALTLTLGLSTLYSCNSHKEENADTTDVQIAALNERLGMAQDTKDSLIFLMSDIYSGIEEINVQEGLLYNLRGSENAAARAEILDNLTRIRTELQDKQAKLDALTGQLNATNDKNGQLAQEVSNLKALITKKEAQISQLEGELKNARAEISNLQDTVRTTRQQVNDITAEKELAQEMANQEAAQKEQLITEANTVFVAIGKKKELEQNNILKKKVIQPGSAESSLFKTYDKRTLTSIPCYSKNVKEKNIYPARPANSYRIQENADKTKTIVITNPAAFWGTSNYLVVQI